jgi:hypothetical protein
VQTGEREQKVAFGDARSKVAINNWAAEASLSVRKITRGQSSMYYG